MTFVTCLVLVTYWPSIYTIGSLLSFSVETNILKEIQKWFPLSQFTITVMLPKWFLSAKSS
jgi:hypothetical protein